MDQMQVPNTMGRMQVPCTTEDMQVPDTMEYMQVANTLGQMQVPNSLEDMQVNFGIIKGCLLVVAYHQKVDSFAMGYGSRYFTLAQIKFQ